MKSELKTLANGMRVLVIPRAHSNLEVFQFFVNAGSKNETKENNGISHLVEHMLYEGSQNYPGEHLLKAFADLGIFPEGVTNSYCTKFCCSFLKNDAARVMELMAELLMRPLFPPHKINTEKEIILKENAELYGEFMFHMKYMQAAFGIEPHLSNPCGTEETIRSLSLADVLDYWRKYYTAPNTLLVASGGAEAEQVFALAEQYFAEFNAQETEQPKRGAFQGGSYFNHRLPDKTALVSLDFYIAEENNRFAATLLAHLLGGGLSSILMKELRQKRTLVYGVSATTERYYHGNLFDITAECYPENMQVILELVKSCLHKVCNHKIPEIELERAKKKLCLDFAIGSSLDEARCTYYGENLLIKNTITDEDDFIRNINAVTREDVLETAKRIFTTNAVVVTQGKKCPSYKELKKVFEK